jgi:hypothetical protein
MGDYARTKSPADFAQLDAELKASLPSVQYLMFGAIGSASFTVHTSPDLTSGEITSMDSIIAAHVPGLPAALGSQGGGPGDSLLINGGFRIDQRGRGAVTLGDVSYALDRWYLLNQSGTASASMTATIRDGASIQQMAAAAQRVGFAQVIESVNTRPRGGSTMTLQAAVRASAAMNVRAALLEWNGTMDSVTKDVINDWTSASYTPGNFFISTVSVLGTTAVAAPTNYDVVLSVTGTVSADPVNLIAVFWGEATMAQNATFTVKQAGLYDGANVRRWVPRSYSHEELLARRYFLKLGPGQYVGFCYNATYLYGGGAITFPAVMRVTPTLAAGSAWSVNAGSAGTMGLLNACPTGTGLYNPSNNWTATAHAVLNPAYFDAEL